MSVFAEIFSKNLEEVLYDNNAFLTQMKNVSDYLNGITVHLPNYVTRPTIEINGDVANYDLATTETVEEDVTFNIDAYRIRPFSVSNFDEMITNYSKFEAVTKSVMNELVDYTSKTILYTLSTGVSADRVIETSGDVGVGNSADGSTDVKKLGFQDFLSLQKKFNQDNLPQEGRFLLIDSEMYSEILGDDAIRKALDFGQATLPNGSVGKIAGINIMIKNEIATIDDAGDVNPIGQTLSATDLRAGFAWHSDVVVMAKSQTYVYTEAKNAFKFSDIVSAEQYLGCVNPRFDAKGAYLIKQG